MYLPVIEINSAYVIGQKMSMIYLLVTVLFFDGRGRFSIDWATISTIPGVNRTIC